MITVFLWILFSTIIISLISLIGVFTLSLKEKFLNKIIFALVSLSIGALLGGAFLHLIPEAIEKSSIELAFVFVLLGFFLFFIIEKIFHWRHCHKGHCEIHTFAYTNLIGDSIHNFIDGLIIAGTFVINIPLGITTTLAIALHEIPQELGDFGVLLLAGFKKQRAILFNFLTAITAIVGGIVGFFLAVYTTPFLKFLLPLAAGGFIYIAASDLIPEIKKQLKISETLLNLLMMVIGLGIIYLLKFIE